jgi:hypothetical protein
MTGQLGTSGFEGRVDGATRRALLDVKKQSISSPDVDAVVVMTAAEYAALSPPDPRTLYIVT